MFQIALPTIADNSRVLEASLRADNGQSIPWSDRSGTILLYNRLKVKFNGFEKNIGNYSISTKAIESNSKRCSTFDSIGPGNAFPPARNKPKG